MLKVYFPCTRFPHPALLLARTCIAYHNIYSEINYLSTSIAISNRILIICNYENCYCLVRLVLMAWDSPNKGGVRVAISATVRIMALNDGPTAKHQNIGQLPDAISGGYLFPGACIGPNSIK